MTVSRIALTLLGLPLALVGCAASNGNDRPHTVNGSLAIRETHYPSAGFEGTRHALSLFERGREIVPDVSSIFLSPDRTKAIWLAHDGDIMLFDDNDASSRKIGFDDAGLMDVIWKANASFLVFQGGTKKRVGF